MLDTIHASSVIKNVTPTSDTIRANMYAFNAYTNKRGSNGTELKIRQEVLGDDEHTISFNKLADIKYDTITIDAMYHDNNICNFSFDLSDMYAFTVF